MTLYTPDQETYFEERMARNVQCTLRYDLEKMAPQRKNCAGFSGVGGTHPIQRTPRNVRPQDYPSSHLEQCLGKDSRRLYYSDWMARWERGGG